MFLCVCLHVYMGEAWVSGWALAVVRGPGDPLHHPFTACPLHLDAQSLEGRIKMLTAGAHLSVMHGVL